ncbi:chemotaxis protein CheB [Dehalogenimonas etheniformans]|uniref:protein-glutamate O-methyltransferase n=1 Tax=Dehalogenimonas etheniformans TaxID=1536648 RepID=A0A2P5P6F4_9CHLR|nr:chemotaxis protein CheB [Dehalogenimonas etheniformans]PPD57891.1 SAM-dependent methyltransferase [Dehalogenimonas etheniformans]QNT75457.1 PAS domain-containing protein [Dehalogenimonas etheniformans]
MATEKRNGRKTGEPVKETKPSPKSETAAAKSKNDEAVKPVAPKKPVSGVAHDDFPIVGIGASAGGLEAFTKFLTAAPINTGMAFVLIQHLDPSHASNMVDLLKRYTTMPVQEATDEVKLEQDHVYMIPPNRNMTIHDHTLKLLEQFERPGIAHSIDLFFKSLAVDLKEKAICIIMSGTGTDGTLGAKAVKGELGLVIVQDPETAAYDGMPRSAISNGVADFILPAEAMPAQLVEYGEKSYGKRLVRHSEVEKDTANLALILQLIRARTRRDFSGYKQSTIGRRIERRMGLNQIDTLDHYLHYLREHPSEIDALVKDFLINVTSFFRDPEAFAALKQQLKNLLTSRQEGTEIRAWIPGCATGEEAYSILMTLEEAVDELKKYFVIQVFGTDLDPDAVSIARSGIYPASVSTDISEERLKKFFARKDDAWQIKREYREKLVFAVQDIIADPPFTRMDLISARNLLIYFDSDLQKRMIPLFHYALNPAGILFLGTAETIGEFTQMFSPLDRKWKIYRVENKNQPGFFLPSNRQWTREHPLPERLAETLPARPFPVATPPEMVLLEALPPAVVIDDNQQVIYSHGDTRRYLGFPGGKPNASLMEAAHPEMRPQLAAALRQAAQENREVVTEKARVDILGASQPVRVTVRPISPAGPGETGRFIVTFQELPKSKIRPPKSLAGTSTRVTELEQELQFTRETLRSTIEQLETANEELRSTNEEYQSTNEELQSTNEELETSREELQSVNEELSTVNSEHQLKIDELSTVNDDMKNLLNSTGVAIVYLDTSLKVKRFTPSSTEIFNFIASDVDRPIHHITSQIGEYDIASKASEVLDTLIPVKEIVQSKAGKWYTIRILPYRTIENSIAGVVISFTDISEQERLKLALSYSEAVIDTLFESMVVLDADLKVTTANKAFQDSFKISRAEAEGKLLFDLGDGSWNIPALKEALKAVLEKGHDFLGHAIEGDFPRVGHRRLCLNARRLHDKSSDLKRVLLAIEDVTSSKKESCS